MVDVIKASAQTERVMKARILFLPQLAVRPLNLVRQIETTAAAGSCQTAARKGPALRKGGASPWPIARLCAKPGYPSSSCRGQRRGALVDRQCEPEARAFAGLGLQAHLPTLELDQLARDRQAEASAAVSS